MFGKSSPYLYMALGSLVIFFLIFGFLAVDSQEIMGSLMAAVLGALMFGTAFVTCYWIYRVFSK